MFDPDITWGYDNAPNPQTHGRVIPCPRGKVLGGSSSINGHAYVRGQALDYEDWVELGARGWGWQDVLPYFKHADTRPDGDPAVRGTDGPLHVQDPRYLHPLAAAFLESMSALGQRRNPDYNSGDQEGCGYYQQLVIRGRRWSAADAYLRPAMVRPNLHVRTLTRQQAADYADYRRCFLVYSLASCGVGEETAARAAKHNPHHLRHLRQSFGLGQWV
jgi:choline dehydrogenase